MENLIDNPLYRLHDFLVKAKEIEPKTSTGLAWKTCLKTGANLPGVVYGRMNQLHNLIHASYAVANKHVFEDQDDISHGAEWFSAALFLLKDHDYNTPWSIPLQRITPKVMSDLKNHARLYSKITGVGRINKEDVESFREKIAEILNDFLVNPVEGMPVAIRDLIQESLMNIVDAIENYQIGGWGGVKAAYSTAFGETLFNKALVENYDWKSVLNHALLAFNIFIAATDGGQAIEWTQDKIKNVADIIDMSKCIDVATVEEESNKSKLEDVDIDVTFEESQPGEVASE